MVLLKESMPKRKKPSTDQIEHLDSLCNDYCIATTDLQEYLQDVMYSHYEGYTIIKGIMKDLNDLKEKIEKLSVVVEEDTWELIDSDRYDKLDTDDDQES